MGSRARSTGLPGKYAFLTQSFFSAASAPRERTLGQFYNGISEYCLTAAL